MNETFLIVLIIVGIVGLIIIYKFLKPYILRYNTTIMLTGELGAGKTLTGAKLVKVLIKKARFKVAFYNKIKLPIANKYRKLKTNHLTKKFKKGRLSKEKYNKLLTYYKQLEKKRRPQVFSTTPIMVNAKRFSKQLKPEYSVKLTLKHVLLIEKIPEYSVIFFDELPQFVNQFNWDNPLVQNKLNEFITFFRHYIDGHIVGTAQSIMDVVIQIRRKLNRCTWAYDFKKHLFGLFYTIRMCDIMINDTMQTISTSFLEDNTKLHFGLFPPKETYNTRCYSPRYNNCLDDPMRWVRYTALKTTEIMRIEKYTSPLDDKTTKEQKQKMKKEIEQL